MPDRPRVSPLENIGVILRGPWAGTTTALQTLIGWLSEANAGGRDDIKAG